jgi:hypothetical protein
MTPEQHTLALHGAPAHVLGLRAPASVGTATMAASDHATGGEQRAADQQHDPTPQITTRCS